MKIIFIAGPYIGDGSVDSVEKNIRSAEKYQLALANREMGFYCSHNHSEHFATKKGVKASDDFFYKLDLGFLRRAADAIIAIPGWKSSKGAKQEVALGKKLGLPIFYPKSVDDLYAVEKWYKTVE